MISRVVEVGVCMSPPHLLIDICLEDYSGFGTRVIVSTPVGGTIIISNNNKL